MTKKTSATSLYGKLLKKANRLGIPELDWAGQGGTWSARR